MAKETGMDAPALRLQQIIKAYNNTVILDVPELALPYGLYWLLGGNGAGKTTCLRVMAGLIPFSGDVLLQDGTSCRLQPVQYRRQVSYAPAEPLYPGFVSGNDLLRLYESTKGSGYATLQQLALQLGAGSFLQQPVSSYSSGMLKKLSLVLAFSGRPRVILLDEPLITLDAATIPALYELVQQFHEQHGVTFCITSHQPMAARVTRLAIEQRNIVPVENRNEDDRA